MKRLHLLTIVVAVLAFGIWYLKENDTTAMGKGQIVPTEWLANTVSENIPAADRRPADQTFLTYPEWYLVYGPEEQANYFAEKTSSSFRFMKQVGSLWKSYGIMYDQVKDNFKFNTGYHVMIMVISVSSTAEFGGKALYETTIGRLTDTGDVVTPEDKFNAEFTADYVQFIKVRPWYEYDFKTKLKELWALKSNRTGHWFRRADRKFILTSELLIKIVYGKLIGLGTGAAYETAKPNTVIEVTGYKDSIVNSDIEVIKYNPGGVSVLSVPRYAAFTKAVKQLAEAGCKFESIAGNNGALLFTVLGSDLVPANDGLYVQLFRQNVASTTDKQLSRTALVTTVPKLHETVKFFDEKSVQHIYDY